MMLLFIMTLLVQLSVVESTEAGGTPKKPPEIETEPCPDYATAYYWDMYGATTKLNISQLRLAEIFPIREF